MLLPTPPSPPNPGSFYGAGVFKHPAGTWVIGAYIVPVNPNDCQFDDNPRTEMKAALGYARLRTGDKMASGRLMPKKKFSMRFPVLEPPFYSYIYSLWEFGNPVAIECPLMDAVTPEVCYTDPGDEVDYCRVYYATQRRWKTSDYAVYVNNELQSTGFTVNTLNGTITFNTAKSPSDIITATYIWNPTVVITSVSSTHIPGYADPVLSLDVSFLET